MNIVEQIEAEEVAKQLEKRGVPDFKAGDTIKVNVKVVEGNRQRVQAYEGVCIARKNDGVNSSFTVRKISFGEGVERVFPLYGPVIDSIEVIRHGKVRRAKLYYLRDRRGRSARISEDRKATLRARAAERAAREAAAAELAAQPQAEDKAPEAKAED